jgi:hypothetical protein
MSAGLIKHLKKKTEEDSNTRILMSQWEFDEKLVGKSLENVGSYYPHFSSHNESHSQQILVNIERLLGSNIEKLTATDTWLILEAAYWHDIGMLFNADEVQKAFEENDFKEYVESLANDNTQDLHEFAKVWHEDGWNKALVNHSDPHTGVEKYRQMIAEWYRRGHAKNSNAVVLDPFEKLGISSPRTELLPKRIYRYLGQICWAHGLGFDDYVMKTLPFRQTGMGTENCHPRFVACLLRLGDLFDIDDNRFCPVMARQVGNMPSFSETHKHKHQAIREFQLDNETVSITAICSTEMAYIECRNWFDWIKEEIQNQMSQWKNIVPHRDFGLLPTINKLDVEMTDKKILLNDKPMKFSLDERSAIELLQGNNLYKDDMSIYRELIQNAIDATMIRVWLEHGQEYSTKKLPKNANPYDAETRELFADYPITLDCKKVADNEDSTLWEFSIEDNGVGISRTDLEYMQKIAGSKNNKEKQKNIRQMPPWMRPSGEFGIGLHSAFLLMKNLPVEKQKILILTKSRLTHESLKIELNSPLSGKSGYCFIEEIDDLGAYGTKLIIMESLSKKIEPLSNSYFINRSLYSFNDHELNIWKKLNKIHRTITNNTIKLIIPNYRNQGKENSINSKIANRDNMYWHKESKVALKFTFLEYGERYSIHSLGRIYRHRTNPKITLFHKGQILKGNVTYSPDDKIIGLKNKKIISSIFNIAIDIYLPAGDILNLSREEIKDDGLVEKLLVSACNSFIIDIESNKYDPIILFEENLNKKSLFLKLIGCEHDENWKNFLVDENLTLSNVLSKKIINLYDVDSSEENPYRDYIENGNIETIKSMYFKGLFTNELFRRLLHEQGFKLYYMHDTSTFVPCLISKISVSNNMLIQSAEFDESALKNTSIDSKLIDIKDILKEFVKKINGEGFDRGLLDCLINFDNLDLKFIPEDCREKISSGLRIESGDIDFIVFPYISIDEKIIELDNKYLFELLQSHITKNFSSFDESYSFFKDSITTLAKEKFPDWYEAYIIGKDFKPLDLTHLDKLHKPTI